MNDSFNITVPFPDPEPDPEDPLPNVKACCESDAQQDSLASGCENDCARAACNEVFDRLLEKVDDNPCPMVLEKCTDAYDETLATWTAFFEENYGNCLQAVSTGQTFSFAEAPGLNQSQLGYAWNGQLTIDCSIDANPATSESVPCTENENPEMAAVGDDWVCPLTGVATISDGTNSDTTSLQGTVEFTEGICASDPCWFDITALSLQADDFSSGGYRVSDIGSNLAWDGFGLINGDVGKIGALMLGLDVSMDASTPSTPENHYDFPIVNSDPASFQVRPGGHFGIVKAEFAWSTGEVVTISTDLATCVAQ